MAGLGGVRNRRGVPVLAKVAAILRAIWPDLPMPLTMTRPWQLRISASAAKFAVDAAAQRGDRVGCAKEPAVPVQALSAGAVFGSWNRCGYDSCEYSRLPMRP